MPAPPHSDHHASEGFPGTDWLRCLVVAALVMVGAPLARANPLHGSAGDTDAPAAGPQIINNLPSGYARPFIWVRDVEKAGIQDKIANNAWATSVYNGMVSRVATDLASHQSDRDAFLRELPVEWTLATPKFKTIPAYSESSVRTPAEARFNDALDCAVLYYLTGDTNYARCAGDILHNAVKTLLPVTASTNTSNGGWIFQTDFLKEARVNGTQLAIVYDFLYSWLQTNQVYDVKTAAMVNFNFINAQSVFRKYYQLARDHGSKETNWSALEATTMLNNLLALDDPAERSAALQVYLVNSTSKQASLDYDYRNYTQAGDIWPESLQYASAVGWIRSTHMVLLERVDPDLNLFNAYPNLPLSLPRISYLRYPNGNQVTFGDGIRTTSGQPYVQYELLYQHALARGRTDLTSFFGSLINGGVAGGNHNRSTLRAYATLGTQTEPLQLLWQAATLPEPAVVPELPRTDTLPFAGIALQRNRAPAQNTNYGLMCFVGGAGHVHSHASGMGMEVFGMGHVMGAKSGTGSYGTDINENYYRLFASNNTIVVNGASRGEGGWGGFDINTVQTVAMEPQPLATAVSPNFSFTCSSFADDKGTLAEGAQQRTMAIVRTSPTTGYYVDVFRSKSTVTNRTATTLNGPVTNQYHDYIYRNIGETAVDLRADGVTLPLISQPNRFQNDIGDANAQPGWRYFTNTVVSYPTSASVRAQFVATVSGTPRYMDMHMPAVTSREYAKVDSPEIQDAPSPYDSRVAPTLVVRQIGEAWNKAFATVFEPHFGSTGGTVQNVTQLLRSGIVVGVKVESSVAGKNLVHYIISNPGAAETYTDSSIGLSFTGRFGIASDNGDGSATLYLGSGSSISYLGNSVATVSGSHSQAEVRFVPGQSPVVTSNSPVNAVSAPSLFATWVPTAGSSGLDWTSATHWNPAGIPNGVGEVASKSIDLAGDQTVNVNTPVTLGELVVGDSSGSQTTLLRKNTAGAFVFDQPDSAMAYLTRTAGGTGDVTLNHDLDIALNDNLTVRLAGGSANSTLTIAGTLSGAGYGLIKEGSSLTLNLSGTNTYTGTTAVTGGVLRLGSPTALGGGNLTLSGGGVIGLAAADFSRPHGGAAGQLQWAGNGGFAAYGADRSVTIGSAISWSTTTLAGKTIILGAADSDATLIWSSGISIAGSSRTIQVINGTAAVDARISGVISAAGTLNKTGTGTLAVSNTNTFTGGVVINGGTLQLGNTGTTGGFNAISSMTITSGTLAVNRGDAFNQSTDLAGRIISGAGSFVQAGSGTTTLSAANTYTGATTISAGTLALGASNVLAATTAVSIGNATLDASTFTNTVGTLDVTGTGGINLGTGAALAFANSSAGGWNAGTLKLTGTFVSGSSLRFGTNSSGLTSAQLALITGDGFASFSLDPNGYLIGSLPQGYDAWKLTHAPTGTAADDFDGDGVANGIEYVLGGTASTNDFGKLPTISTRGGDLVFSFIRAQSSIDGTTTVAIEAGTDLVSWTSPSSPYAVPAAATGPVNPGVTVVKDSPGAGFDTVSLMLSLTQDAQKFVRLKVTP